MRVEFAIAPRSIARMHLHRSFVVAVHMQLERFATAAWSCWCGRVCIYRGMNYHEHQYMYARPHAIVRAVQIGVHRMLAHKHRGPIPTMQSIGDPTQRIYYVAHWHNYIHIHILVCTIPTCVDLTPLHVAARTLNVYVRVYIHAYAPRGHTMSLVISVRTRIQYCVMQIEVDRRVHV